MSDDGPLIRDALASKGRVRLDARPYTIASPDDSNHALTLAAGAGLYGEGRDLTTLNIIVDGLAWGIALTKAQCRLADMTVNFIGKIAPSWMVGMPGTPNSSAQRCGVTRVTACIAPGATIPIPTDSTVGAGFFAIGPDRPGVSTFDPANARLNECYAVNQSGQPCSGYLLGNGTSGNVVEITCDDCTVSACTYGIQLAGCGVRWNAGGMNANDTDIYVQHGNTDPIVFTGLRGENGGRVIWGGNIGPLVAGATLVNCVFGRYSKDQVVQWNAQGTLTFQGGHIDTISGNTSFGLNTNNGPQIPGLVTIGLHTDATNPYPAAKPSRYIRKAIARTYGARPTPAPDIFDLPMVA